MTAPLAHFLTRFSAPPPVALDLAAEVEPPPLITLTADDLDERIAAARRIAVSQALERNAAEVAALSQAHAAAIQDALAAARSAWSAAEGERLAVLLNAAVTELRTRLSERIAAVLCPWLAETVRARARQGLLEALDRLLAEAAGPCLKVCGPEDLLGAMREARPNAAVEWQIADAVDVTVIANTTRLETRLAASLPDLVTEG